MSVTETYTCDICGDKKGQGGQWFLAWTDCLPAAEAGDTQPLIKLTRWEQHHAHTQDVLHLCGTRCASTMMDRWMSQQHEQPTGTCA